MMHFAIAMKMKFSNLINEIAFLLMEFLLSGIRFLTFLLHIRKIMKIDGVNRQIWGMLVEID